jgi:hypothetical protein
MERATSTLLKEEDTMTSARKTPDTEALGSPLTDEGSSIRERGERGEPEKRSERPRRRSDPQLCLNQRLDNKLIAAMALLSKLEPQDARARLLHIAVLRRDESLLDGILAELATAPSTQSSTLAPRRSR